MSEEQEPEAADAMSLQALEEAYRADLPGRLAAFEAHLNGVLDGRLPDGTRFEWVSPTVEESVAVSAEMGIDPAAPMTREQRSEFTRRAARRREGATDGE